MRSQLKKSFVPRPAADGSHVRAKTPVKKAGSRFFTRTSAKKLKADDITFIFRNLSTLLENGVSLPRALGALADEKALERCQATLTCLRNDLEEGSTFSAALSKHGSSFDIVTINQVRVGERAGSLASTLDHIATQRETSGKLRDEIIKKLAYPTLLVVVGTGVIVFLLTYVIPVFEETYRSAKVPLPWITQTLISVGRFGNDYGIYLLGGIALAILGFQKLRRQDAIALQMDAWLLKIPLVGDWLRDVAVLEFMEVLGNLMDAGFTLAEALTEAADSVGNRVVKQAAADLRSAVNRGERFSREIERLGDLFPPVVSQLVIVGEQTGKLAKATRHIRTHLQEEIQRRASLFVGVIEPSLTATLAAAVAVILLAIYLPMFDMINAVGG